MKALEEEIRTKYTTKELVIAQTMWEALDKKVKKVEELLESLQDEVWEAEEEQEETSGAKKEQSQPDPEFSLLDQVLAMILGTIPNQPGMSSQEHYKFVQEEHKSIVREWKEHFGRLPPPAGASAVPVETASKTPAQKRLDLGIADNDEDDWEAIDSDDEKLEEKKPSHVSNTPTKKTAKETTTEPKKPTKPKVVGLRPGGSLGR